MAVLLRGRMRDAELTITGRRASMAVRIDVEAIAIVWKTKGGKWKL